MRCFIYAESAAKVKGEQGLTCSKKTYDTFLFTDNLALCPKRLNVIHPFVYLNMCIKRNQKASVVLVGLITNCDAPNLFHMTPFSFAFFKNTNEKHD